MNAPQCYVIRTLPVFSWYSPQDSWKFDSSPI